MVVDRIDDAPNTATTFAAAHLVDLLEVVDLASRKESERTSQTGFGRNRMIRHLVVVAPYFRHDDFKKFVESLECETVATLELARIEEGDVFFPIKVSRNTALCLITAECDA